MLHRAPGAADFICRITNAWISISNMMKVHFYIHCESNTLFSMVSRCIDTFFLFLNSPREAVILFPAFCKKILVNRWRLFIVGSNSCSPYTDRRNVSMKRTCKRGCTEMTQWVHREVKFMNTSVFPCAPLYCMNWIWEWSYSAIRLNLIGDVW